VARFDKEINIAFHKMAIHGDDGPIRKYAIRVLAKFFDETENIIPAPAVKPS
jgi:hypothetical protein